MTREYFKDKLFQPKSGSDAFNKGVKQANSRANRLFKQAIDDFESRTCDNCKYYDGDRSFLECTYFNMSIPTSSNRFGCNAFKET